MKTRLESILNRIHQAAISANRNPDSVRLVAVSKTMPVEKIRQAIAAGAHTFGENYIQEAREKGKALAQEPIVWHFIGHLQSNKAKYAVRQFELIHSVDSVKLARELNRYAANLEKVQQILIQVNISGEVSKSGVAPDDLPGLIREVATFPNISIRGLMTMPPFFDDPDRARPYFSKLRQLRDQIADMAIPGVSMDELSMGMTGDFEVAIQEGATLVRIGTAIFGHRS